MLRHKTDHFSILTSSALYSPSQWVPFTIYESLPKFSRFAPNPFMFNPMSYFHVFITWHSNYPTVFPHSRKYRMLRAISTNNLEEVVKLLEDGFPINEPIEQKYGYNCLQVAAINNHYPLIEMLSLRGANINQTDRWGNTPLHLAIINQNHEAIHSLLKNGSNPNIRNNYGFSALDKASASPSILDFMKQYSESKRNIPKFRVKLKLQQKLKNPFWEQMLKLKIYSGKVRQHLMSKWQFDFTDHNTVQQLLQNKKSTNDLEFQK